MTRKAVWIVVYMCSALAAQCTSDEDGERKTPESVSGFGESQLALGYYAAVEGAGIDERFLVFVGSVHEVQDICQTVADKKALQWEDVVRVILGRGEPGRYEIVADPQVGRQEAKLDILGLEDGHTRSRLAAIDGNITLEGVARREDSPLHLDIEVAFPADGIRELECVGTTGSGGRPPEFGCICERDDGSQFDCISGDMNPCCHGDNENVGWESMKGEGQFCPSICSYVPGFAKYCP